jgi:saccharopine dehydrogenase-like NADP-dependent oxidoreductase
MMRSVLIFALCVQTHALVHTGKLNSFRSTAFRTFSTISTEVDTGNALQKEALAKFLPGPATFRPTTGGVSNFMSFVKTEAGEDYILRIYNNGKNSEVHTLKPTSSMSVYDI